MPLFIGCDNVLKYSGAHDADVTPASQSDYLNALTVTYVVNDSNGTQITTGTLSYVSSSNGNYKGTIDGAVTAALTVGALYTIIITATGGGYDDERFLDETAARRGAA